MESLERIIEEGAVREVRRAIAVKMYLSGIETKGIVEVLGVSDKFVSKWKVKYEREGAAALRLQHKGSKGYLTKEERVAVVEWIGSRETITTDEVIEELKEKYGVVYQSKQSYYDLLKAGRMSWHKSEKSNPKKDMGAVIAKRQEIKKKLSEHREEIREGKLVVLMEDESHLIWGDASGYVWGRRNQKIAIPMVNFRERQTYFGALNLKSQIFHVEAYPRGDGNSTVDFVKKLQEIYAGSKLLLIWDGASYHKYSQMKAYLGEINKGLDPDDWKVSCMLFAPHAPEQNPVEDIWLAGKNWIRKHFIENNTFAQVKACFAHFLNNRTFQLQKILWYYHHILYII